MATVTAGKTFTSGETVTPEKLNALGAPAVAVADDEVTTAKILDAAVTAAKLADGAVTGTKVDATVITGQTAEAALADADTFLFHDASAAALRKVTKAQMESAFGVADGEITAAKLDGAQTGAAPIYGCRAWVNFNGTTGSTVGGEFRCTINASGNVAKVVRLGTGSFEVYFTVAMPDANYSYSGNATVGNGYIYGIGTQTTSKLAFLVSNNSQYLNPTVGCIQIFR